MKPKARRQALYLQLKKVFVSEFVEAIVAAVLVAMLLRFFIVSVYRVPTESMRPTLLPGDLIVAWKTSYGIPVPFSDQRIGARLPERGDVVIVDRPEEGALFVKRVVGVPGDRIEVREGRLIVNEVVAMTFVETTGEFDSYDEFSGRSTHRVIRRHQENEADFLAPIVVPPGHVFLMGDFRSESADSRQWGPVAAQQVIARVSFVGASLNLADSDASGRIRIDRFFKSIE